MSHRLPKGRRMSTYDNQPLRSAYASLMAGYLIAYLRQAHVAPMREKTNDKRGETNDKREETNDKREKMP